MVLPTTGTWSTSAAVRRAAPGLVMLEASAVLPEGRISPGDLGIWKDEHIPELERIARFIHSQGARAGIQLAHAGRKGSMSVPFAVSACLLEEGGWQPVGQLGAFAPNYAVPGRWTGRNRRGYAALCV